MNMVRKLFLFTPLLLGLVLLQPVFNVATIWADHARAPYQWHVVPRVGAPYDAKVHRQLDGSWQVSPADRATFYVKNLDELDFMEIATTPSKGDEPSILRQTLPLGLLVLLTGSIQLLVLRRSAKRADRPAGPA